MINKQEQTDSATAQLAQDILNYNINATTIHYILHNLFRSLKPIRCKYRLTINEIIFLNGIYLYCKHISTCISQNACLKFISYYNLGKVKYYLGSLLRKGMIQVAEIINRNIRYKLTQAGLSVMNDINGGFERCLYQWFQKYNVVL